jgi:signal transduction histidine kinase
MHINDKELVNEIAKRLEEKNASIKEMEFLNSKLLELNRRLTDADSEKDKFLSLIKNEFNNPITSVLNLCKVLLRKNAEKEIVDMMNMELLKLDFQIKNIISASEIEAGKTENYYSVIDFDSLFNDCLYNMKYNIEDKSLKLNLINQLEENFISDSAKVYMILLNLISNAIKFSFDNTEINIFLRIINNECEIVVVDTGITIEVKNKMKVFNRFTKIAKYDGLGLGLSVVRGYCEALGGSVDFYNIDDTTNFVIKIPLVAEDMLSCNSSLGSNEFFFEDLGSFEL